MKRLLALTSLVVLIWWSADTLSAFCGFYVCKADTRLFNKASQVVLVRDDDKTVLTMANDFKGDAKEFAIMIPVTAVRERGQIHIGDKALLDHLDAYSAPRLVEYFDENPCTPSRTRDTIAAGVGVGGALLKAPAPRSLDTLGVRIEASYTIGEYDILILSAQESGGLETWLRRSGYQIPSGASAVLASYIRQGMKFFVARVNLKEQAKLGFTFLRPIQVAYESPKFMLPIRLGMVNAAGPQELFVYALTRRGRVEATNYRTVKLPTGMDLPVYVKQEFPAFYRAMFDLKHGNAALWNGAYGGDQRKLTTSGGDRVYAYTRSRGDNTVLVAVNFGDAPSHVSYRDLAHPGAYTDWFDKRTYTLDAAGVLDIPAHGYRLLVTPAH